MSTEPPQPPAFLTQPLTCPPNRCNYPGRPLPAFPSELETILLRWIQDDLEHEFQQAAIVKAVARVRRSNDDVRSGIRRSGKKPSDLVLRFVPSPRGDRSPPKEIAARRTRILAKILPSVAQITINTFDDGREKISCLHDFLDHSQSELWGRLEAAGAAARDAAARDRDAAALEKPDARATVDYLIYDADRGDIDTSGWGTMIEWERDVTLVYAGYTRQVREFFAKEMRESFRQGQHSVLLDRSGAVATILSHLLSAASTLTMTPSSFLAQSSGFAELVRHFDIHTTLSPSFLATLSPIIPSEGVSVGSDSPNGRSCSFAILNILLTRRNGSSISHSLYS